MELVLSYLAGSIDADGSFTIRVDKTMVNKGAAKFATYQEMISLKQVTPEVPHLLKETFGGCLYLQGPSVTKGRPLWTWHISSKKAARAVAALLPHLRIKRKQAQLLIELRALKDAFNAIPNKRLSEVEIERRESIRSALRALNRVGI